MDNRKNTTDWYAEIPGFTTVGPAESYAAAFRLAEEWGRQFSYTAALGAVVYQCDQQDQ